MGTELPARNRILSKASPQLTVNKYSPLAALPPTVRALAPIAFQVQTGKGREEREMADRRFNLLLAAVFIGGALPIQQGCQLPGIAPGPHFFLLTFIIVLLRASPQPACPRLRSGRSFPGLDKQAKSQAERQQTDGPDGRTDGSPGKLCTRPCCSLARGTAEGEMAWRLQAGAIKKETSR